VIARFVLLLAAFAAACGPVPDRPTVGWTEPEPGLFVTGPYVIPGGADRAFIVVKQSGRNRAPVVEWWPDSASELVAQAGEAGAAQVRAVTADSSDGLWVAALEGLPTGEPVRYRVRSGDDSTEVYSFKVGTKPGEPFRFAAFGDTRTGHDVHRRVVEAIAAQKPDLVLHTGDMVERGGVEEQWDRFFQIERPLLANAPLLVSIGNHDYGNRHLFRRFFLHERWARNQRYYAHDWGNLRVIAMDGGIECRDGCAQYAFVDRVLAEGAEKGMFMVLILHYPPYSSGKHGSHKGVQKPITALAKRHGVELVIAGHDHNYERTKEIEGVTYVVSGSAGAPIRAVKPRWFTAHARTEPHYVLVDVERDRMVLRAINLRGDTFDTHILNPNPPQPD